LSAREFSTAVPAGKGYSTLPRTIIISIINFKLFDCAEFYSKFQPLEVTRHTLLSDKMGFHFFELPKLPKDISEKNMLLLWLALFKAETEEELEKIKALEVPVMSQAINAYYSITASSEFREIERLREKARHDEAQALHSAERKRTLEIAKNMLLDGEPVEKITRYTTLTVEEVETLRTTIVN
jgi:predicted transposase/invertase (TIGR01784 family)